MKEELLNQIKNDYFKKLKQNEKNKNTLEILKTRRSFLENNSIIKQYLNLQKQIATYEKEIYNDDYILQKSLNNYIDAIKSGESSNIFVYLGSYVYDIHNNEFQIDRTDKNLVPDFNLYANIETADFCSVDYVDCAKFESENTVLVVNNFPNATTFYDLRNDFFNDSFQEGEKSAIQKVLKRNKKK